jgi:hypothetical protein
MIQLLDDTFKPINTFKSDVGLFCYLKEHFKTLDEEEKQRWNFTQYSQDLLVPFVQKINKKEMAELSFTYMASQAVQQKKSLVVMCKGDVENPSLFLFTSDLDIVALQKEWSEHYCAAHNMYILRE